MPTWVRILDRIVISVTVPIKTMRVMWIGHDTVRRDKPPHLRQIIPGIHVDKTQVVHIGVVHPMPGEAPVRDARINVRPRLGAIDAVGVVASQGATHQCPAGGRPGADVAQLVGIGIVVVIGCGGDDPYSNDLTGQRESYPFGGSATCRYGFLVVGEGGVDLRPVGLHGQGAVAVGSHNF